MAFSLLDHILDGSIILKLLSTTSSYLKSIKASALAINVSKVYFGDVISKVFGLGTIILLIRGLNVNDYASYIAFYTILNLMPGLIGNGINMSLVRFSSEHISSGSGNRPLQLYLVSFVFQFVLYLVLCVILLIFAENIKGIFFGDKVFGYAFQYGLLAGLGWLLTQAGRSIYQAEERFETYVKTLWARQLSVLIIISFLFISKKLNFQTVSLSIVIMELIIGSTIVFHTIGNLNIQKFQKVIEEHRQLIKDFLSSSGWLVAYFFILAMVQRVDIFLLSHLSSKIEIANYGVSYNYYAMALLILGSINVVLLPRFSKADMQSNEKHRDFIFKWIKNTSWLIMPIIILDIICKPVFMWVNGAQYEKAYYIFVIFSFSVWLSLMLSPLVNVLISRKAFRFMFIVAVLGFVINFIGNYYMIPKWGGMGSAFIKILSHNLLIQGLILIRILK